MTRGSVRIMAVVGLLLAAHAPLRAQCIGAVWGTVCGGMGNNTYCRHCVWAMCDITCSSSQDFYNCLTTGQAICDLFYPSYYNTRRPAKDPRIVLVRGVARGAKDMVRLVANEPPAPDTSDSAVWHGVLRMVDIFNQEGDTLSAQRLPELMGVQMNLQNQKRLPTAAELDSALAAMEEPVRGLVKQLAADIVADGASRLSAAQKQHAVSLTRHFLQDPAWEVREKGLKLAVVLKLPDAKSLLEAKLRDPDPLVRQAAAAFLGRPPVQVVP